MFFSIPLQIPCKITNTGKEFIAETMTNCHRISVAATTQHQAQELLRIAFKWELLLHV